MNVASNNCFLKLHYPTIMISGQWVQQSSHTYFSNKQKEKMNLQSLNSDQKSWPVNLWENYFSRYKAGLTANSIPTKYLIIASFTCRIISFICCCKQCRFRSKGVIWNVRYLLLSSCCPLQLVPFILSCLINNFKTVNEIKWRWIVLLIPLFPIWSPHKIYCSKRLI